jgi:hypothetical protein
VDGTDVDEVLGRVPGQRQPVGATSHNAATAKQPGKERATARRAI